jgi:Icc-related predicted phosphoesterase
VQEAAEEETERSMKLQILSDLHLEHHRDRGVQFVSQLPVVAEILIVAGDLCNGDELLPTLDMLAAKWKDVVYVFGNHELYGHSFASVRENLVYINETRDNVHVLDNSLVSLRGQRFVGTPLWFHWHKCVKAIKAGLLVYNDFKAIRSFDPQVFEENAKAVRFLQDEVCAGDVVITHSAPSPVCVPARFEGDPINPMFFCDVSDLIRERKPALWVHGHTHDAIERQVGATRCICNPFGYGWENTGFMDDLVVEI